MPLRSFSVVPELLGEHAVGFVLLAWSQRTDELGQRAMTDHRLGVDRDHRRDGLTEVTGDPVQDIQGGIGLTVFQLAQIAL